MIEINAKADQAILSMKASGKLTRQDLEEVEPKLQNFTSLVDDPHLIMILEDFEGWEDAAAFWKDLQLDSEYIGYFDRIAVVGEQKWQEWGTRLLNPITKEELQFFPLEQADKAWEWAQENHN